MPARRARIDDVVDVTRPTTIALARDTQVVITRFGIVLADRQRDWTWYRWVMAGQWWSVTVSLARSERQATREAMRLIQACRERFQRRR